MRMRGAFGKISKASGTFLRRQSKRLIFAAIVLLILGALAAGGFFLAESLMDQGLVGLVIGLVVGIIVAAIIARFISYKYKAAQIAMMTRAITDCALPDNVRAEGFRVVKERFATVAVYFAVTGAVKGVFQQLGRLITGVAGSIGGDTGKTVGGAVSSAVQTMVSYLCDCCLGWIFYRAGKNAFKAACEGAVLFFRHGKSFLKNMGRIFGIGIASFIVIGGAFTGVIYLVFSRFPAWFNTLSAEIMTRNIDNGTVRSIVSDPATLTVAVAAIAAIILWSIFHSVLVRPFILVGVLRNYISSGVNDIPTENSFSELAMKCPKFAELERRAS